MPRLLDRPVPNPGTKYAVRYWTARAREAAREIDRAMSIGDTDTAASWAADLVGVGGELELAIAALESSA